ncbi:MAG: FHA domain-containing protein, partial [Planctomycetia bacterium]|nr:FHA domain-containing protein [Planctomycetia bacterium]
MDVRFVIRSPSGKRRNGVVPLPVLVGRGEEAKIRIPQDAVSRRHCQFVERDGHVYIRDLGSTNGTLLDGKRVQPDVDTPVSSGGTVSVGDVQIRVEYTAPRAADDDRTILLKRLPDVDVAEAADADQPGVIELGAASDETQSDAGQPFEIEPQAAEPSAPVAAVEPAAPRAA